MDSENKNLEYRKPKHHHSRKKKYCVGFVNKGDIFFPEIYVINCCKCPYWSGKGYDEDFEIEADENEEYILK